ncbi:V-type proton ATPase subunit S1-like protein isoform X6 [Cebus imitator]|uniref:V-type proton ATPase subunit S1-like protein isoform X6 n=1 Tax=Cebus imitator TaxID=2715852 RepID=UPI00189A1338|nr:V-type proton ATPase subunit S1-like protein isoform X6 [Cebus imitator]
MEYILRKLPCYWLNMLSVTWHEKYCLCSVCIYELTDVLALEKLILLLMGKKILFSVSLIFLCIGFSLALEHIFARKNVRLSLKLGDAENPRSLAIRFILTNYNKLSIQSWFSLRQVEIVSNNSIQAVFNPAGIYAPSGYSYRCQRVGSLQRDHALLLPSDTDDGSSLWEVTFIDFQIQGFAIKGGRFTKARDCASSSSPAILIGLATSLILLLVLAYALNMLIYLRYLDRHYDLIASPAHFPQLKARDTAKDKELLRSQEAECYELRRQQLSKTYA